MVPAFVMVCFLVLSCATLPIQDYAAPTIQVKHKRVETVICGRHDVGENGCVFNEGKLTGSLKIKGVFEGSLSIVGSGCNVDYNKRYGSHEDWIVLPLNELVGEGIKSDCLLDIYQEVYFKNSEEVPFTIHAMYGTVTLGICPKNTSCSFSANQLRYGWKVDKIEIENKGYDKILIRGCGEQVADIKNVSPGKITVDFNELPNIKSCLYLVGLSGVSSAKLYNKIWFFDASTLKLSDPMLIQKEKILEFVGDKSVSFTSYNNQMWHGNRGSIQYDQQKGYIRFYTVKGRSLIVRIEGDKIIWKK